MFFVWLMEAMLDLLLVIVGVFDFLSPLDLPSALTLVVPIPMAGSIGVVQLNLWAPVAIATACALAVGRALQWAYQLVPGKMT